MTQLDENLKQGTKRTPKVVKMTAKQYAEHIKRRNVSPEYREMCQIAAKTAKIPDKHKDKVLRKDDMRAILSEKGQRPKGKYYNISNEPSEVSNPLNGILEKIGAKDEVTEEGKLQSLFDILGV